MNLIIRATEHCSRIAYGVAGMLLVVLISLTCFEVVARYVFSSPTIWGLEVAEMINAALFLLAGPLVLKMKGHIVIDVLSVRLPPRATAFIDFVFYTFLLLPSVALIGGYAAREAWRSYLSDDRSLSAWQAPIWPTQLLIFIGLALLCIQIVAEILTTVLRPRG